MINENDQNIEPEHKKGIKNYFDDQIISTQISPIAAAFIGLVGGFFLYQIVGGLLTLIVFGLDVKNAPVNSMRLMTMAGQILFILLPALLFSKMFYNNIPAIFRLRVPHWKEILLFVAGIIILTPLLQTYLYIQTHFINWLAENSSFVASVKKLVDSLNDMMEQAYGSLIFANNFFERIFVIIIVSVVPAICEESMFRGYIQRSFEFKLKPFYAALITAIFFGIYHFNPYGIIPLILLGLYFGFAAYVSNSIVIPMILHFLNNFAAVVLYFAIGDEDLIKSAPVADTNILSSIITLLGLSVLFGVVVVLIKRYYSKIEVS
jgi:membrane protease YdiL (CAAX protease family)